MAYKNRTESKELKVLRFLNYRRGLEESVMNYYFGLEKGFEGETKFDAWSGEFSERIIIINDFLFEINRNVVQIDSLFIAQNACYVFEVKNNEGDYFIEDEIWTSMTGPSIKNPIHQLNRIKTYFPKLIEKLDLDIPLKCIVVFVNPEFHLFNASRDLPIIYPTQLNRFKKELRYEFRNDTIHSKEGNKSIADKLLSCHLNENPYARFPEYEFDQLKKGIACINCHSFNLEMLGRFLVCKKCKCEEHLHTAILRTIDEFTLLFPDLQITTNAVLKWCGGMVSMKTIRRVLSANYSVVKKGNSTYFTK